MLNKKALKAIIALRAKKMQVMGLEPTRAKAHTTLNRTCLPIPTHLPKIKMKDY